jgi:hypothetical protein
MISAREVSYGLYGAYRLAHLDPRGMDYFDDSPLGFWRSFHAALIAAPAYAILVVIHVVDAAEAAIHIQHAWFHLILVESLAYAIGVFAFPLVMFHFTAALDRGDRYLGFIVAYNWAGVLQIGLFLPVTAAISAGLVPGAFGSVLWLAAFLLILFYAGYVARTALRIGSLEAAGVVFVDLSLSFAISWVANGLR